MPASGATSPTTMLKLVVLPAPFGPSSPTTSPGRDLEGDAVHHPAAAVALHEPVGLEGGRAHLAGSFFLRGASSAPGRRDDGPLGGREGGPVVGEVVDQHLAAHDVLAVAQDRVAGAGDPGRLLLVGGGLAGDDPRAPGQLHVARADGLADAPLARRSRPRACGR